MASKWRYTCSEVYLDCGRTDENRPQVIVNSVCPGMVRTDIGRKVADQGWFMKALVWVYLSITAKPPDYGARHYIKAALRPQEEHVSRERADLQRCKCKISRLT